MTKVLVLYHPTYGHIEAMARAVAEGAREIQGAQVDIKRVPELVPEELARQSGYKLDQEAPIATVAELEHYDAIVIGAGTRFGRVASQMGNFLDQAGGLWARGALNGKVGSAFTSTATQRTGRRPRPRSWPACRPWPPAAPSWPRPSGRRSSALQAVSRGSGGRNRGR